MAYLFATSATDNIDCGINVGHGATFSLAVRLRLTASTTTGRRLVHVWAPGAALPEAILL